MIASAARSASVTGDESALWLTATWPARTSRIARPASIAAGTRASARSVSVGSVAVFMGGLSKAISGRGKAKSDASARATRLPRQAPFLRAPKEFCMQSAQLSLLRHLIGCEPR